MSDVDHYWTCPKCGGHLIESVNTNVTVVTDVYITGDADVEFEDQTNHGGDDHWFQCRYCGQKICYGGPEDLLEYIKEENDDE